MRGSSTLCRPRESGDPYAAALRFSTVGRRLSNNEALWLWVPAFAGTTSGSTTFTLQTACRVQTQSRHLAAHFARGLLVNSGPLQSEGAGNTGCTLHPRSRVQQCTKQTHTSIQVQRRQSGIPCAMVLRLISRSPRRSGFLLTVIGGAASADLTPASRRQDHTTLPSA